MENRVMPEKPAGNKFTFTDTDQAVWEEELAEFVPEAVFDAHTHIWSEKNALPDTGGGPLRVEADAAMQLAWHQRVFPGRKAGFMLLGTPLLKINFPADREWCAAESKRLPHTVCGVLVTPQSKAETLAADAVRLGFAALKPYLSYAPHTSNCTISEMLPEHLIEVAEEFHLIIVLHVSRPECFNDPVNQRELEYLIKKYPHVLWQLAHCARSFNSILLEKSVHFLKHLDNVCYDLSAVCDPYTYYLLFKYENPARLMYGSDNLAAGSCRGIYAPCGRGWGLYPETTDKRGTTLICYEALRALRRGAVMAEVPQEEIKRIFWDNAVRIYGLSDAAERDVSR